ncbi:hypothetical protein LCGC14_0758200 [marine sediment metagenome]|uniref:Uncharacterized protein n=1 Tax=marine sediment metagenome TaxID=412755 RepID=A0A0F9T930_9ZZZZ
MCKREGCQVEFVIKYTIQRYCSNACWQIARFKYPFSLKEARRLYATGLPVWRVAFELGVSPYAIRHKFEKYGYA